MEKSPVRDARSKHNMHMFVGETCCWQLFKRSKEGTLKENANICRREFCCDMGPTNVWNPKKGTLIGMPSALPEHTYGTSD